MERETDKKTVRQKEKQTERQIDRKADRQKERQMEKQTDRMAETPKTDTRKDRHVRTQT